MEHISSKGNLCDTCQQSIPECSATFDIRFGDGVKKDNVIKCHKYNGKIDFRDCKIDAEELNHTDKGDAIESALEDIYPNPFPETIAVYGFVKDTISTTKKISIIDYVLESLDDDYGSPEEFSKPTEKMLEAEKEFIEKIKALYTVYRCTCIVKEEINVNDWCSVQDNETKEKSSS